MGLYVEATSSLYQTFNILNAFANVATIAEICGNNIRKMSKEMQY